MKGGEFLDLLDRMRLVPPHLVQRVRAQVESKPHPVLAAAVAKVFVDAGHLTAYQARQLIAGETLLARPAPDAIDALDFSPLDEPPPKSLAEQPAESSEILALEDSSEVLLAPPVEEPSLRAQAAGASDHPAISDPLDELPEDPLAGDIPFAERGSYLPPLAAPLNWSELSIWIGGAIVVLAVLILAIVLLR